MPKPSLRVVDPTRPHARELAAAAVREHRATPFRWQITPEEYADVELATIRESKVNRKLVAESNRMKRYG